MKYLFFIFLSAFIISNKTIAQKINTKKIVTKDASISSNNIKLTPAEEKDDPGYKRRASETWEDAGFKNVKALKLFIKKVKYWAANNIKDSIAANISYPLMTNENITSPEIFIKQYDIIFDQKIKNILQQQKLSQLFRNFQGVMIGGGKIIIANVSKSNKEIYKIINVDNEE